MVRKVCDLGQWVFHRLKPRRLEVLAFRHPERREGSQAAGFIYTEIHGGDMEMHGEVLGVNERQTSGRDAESVIRNAPSVN